jgi:hypothetical protein
MKYGNYKTIKIGIGRFEIVRRMNNWSETYTNFTEPIKKDVMDSQQSAEERLWNYIDGTCNAEEKSAIEKLIESNIEWQKKYRELLQLNELIYSSELEVPSMRFTKNVMEDIAKYQVAPAAKNYIDKKIIWGIGTFFLTMIFGILIYAFSQIHFTGSGGDSGTSEIITKYTPENVDWSKYFNGTYVGIFMMINVILGLVFFDKYLQRKKNQSNQKEA